MFKLAVLLCLVVVAFGAPRSLRPRLADGSGRGYPTTIEEFPWVVSLQVYGSYLCGGSIISEKYILTAAHCAIYASSSYTVRAGSTTLGSGSTIYNVANVVRHSQYNSWTIDYDFALIEINGVFDLNGNNQASVPLPAQDEDVPAGTPSAVTHWGTSAEDGSVIVQVTNVLIVSQASCNAAYNGAITDRMLCADVEDDDGNEPCQGGNGSPLVAEGKLVGIVSWGYTCRHPQYPYIYSRVASVRDWIAQNTAV